MMRVFRRTGGSYERVSLVDNEGCEYDCVEVCSLCIVAEGAKGIKTSVVRQKRDLPFWCEQCQKLVDERWMTEGGRSLLQSPVPLSKKAAIKQ
jgi:hypothetical protein